MDWMKTQSVLKSERCSIGAGTQRTCKESQRNFSRMQHKYRLKKNGERRKTKRKGGGGVGTWGMGRLVESSPVSMPFLSPRFLRLVVVWWWVSLVRWTLVAMGCTVSTLAITMIGLRMTHTTHTHAVNTRKHHKLALPMNLITANQMADSKRV